MWEGRSDGVLEGDLVHRLSETFDELVDVFDLSLQHLRRTLKVGVVVNVEILPMNRSVVHQDPDHRTIVDLGKGPSHHCAPVEDPRRDLVVVVLDQGDESDVIVSSVNEIEPASHHLITDLPGHPVGLLIPDRIASSCPAVSMSEGDHDLSVEMFFPLLPCRGIFDEEIFSP